MPTSEYKQILVEFSSQQVKCRPATLFYKLLEHNVASGQVDHFP
jgi:hypothetical protein